ncbi:FAD:protein FMN transferase [Thalassospira sp. SM2505]
MPAISRRRFLTISAAAGAISSMPFAISHAQTPVQSWKGIAMGAAASITLSHPDADKILASATRELDRLENIFSLYRENSTLSRLNSAGSLDTPPFELLECLGICGTINRASNGLFDPTIQPLWQLYATSYAQGHGPETSAIKDTLTLTGWEKLSISQNRIAFDRPGMALTLNGIAQGYVADRIASLLRSNGLTNVLVNTGEFYAIGGHPDGNPWPISIDTGSGIRKDREMLRDNALATSLPTGTFFDQAGLIGHILDPRSGLPAQARRQSITVTAPKAALADGLSTAMCLMNDEECAQLLGQFPAAKLV